MGERFGTAGEPNAAATWSLQLSKVLVATSSAVLCDLLSRILSCHVEKVLTATSLAESLEHIALSADLSLVLVEHPLADSDGFRLLTHLGKLEQPKPRVIFICGKRDPDVDRRAVELGALGVLVKPICLRDIAGLLLSATQRLDVRGPRRRTSVRAFVVEAGRNESVREPSQLFWYLRDLSTSGAFLETESPLPEGSVLDLRLELGAAEVNVTAEVVRVQQPSWNHSGGVGVRFLRLGERAENALRQHVEDVEAESY